MNSLQGDDFKMFRSVDRFFLDHAWISAGDPMIAAVLAEFRSTIVQIETANSDIINAIGPALRIRMGVNLDLALDAVGKLAAVTAQYAVKVPNQQELHRLMDIKEYELRRMQEADRTQRMLKMIDAAEAVASNVPNNSLQSEDYRNARACLQQHILDGGAARNSDSHRIAAGKLLKALFNGGKQTLRGLDSLMRKFRKPQPDVFLQFKSVRRIVHSGGPLNSNGERAVKLAAKRATKAQQAAAMAAEKARIAAEDAANKAKLAEMRKAAAPKKKDKKSKKASAAEGSDLNSGNAA